MGAKSFSPAPGPRSEAVAGTEQQPRLQLLREPQVRLVAAVGPERRAGDVDRLERDGEPLGDVVADVEIERPERRDEDRVAAGAAIDLRQIFGAPIVGEPRRKAVLVVNGG